MTPKEGKQIASDISSAIGFFLQDRYNIPGFSKEDIREFLIDPPLGYEIDEELVKRSAEDFDVIFHTVIVALESISYIVWSPERSMYVPGPLGDGEVINFAFTRGDHHEDWEEEK